MPGPVEWIDALPSAEWSRLGAIVKRFEAALYGGERRALDTFLPADAALRLPALVELVHVELECRLRHGEPVRIEEYLARYPELAAVPSVVFDLLAAEFNHRRAREPDLSIAEYGGRFPECRDRLSALLRPAETPAPPPASTTHIDTARTFVGTPPPETGSAASPPAEATVPGYEILGPLGRGGMGVVYKARHVGLNRVVALKMILAGQDASAQELARFHVETRAVAKLQHPNIVQIYEVGTAGGRVYCVLEFVDGGSLAQKLAGTPLPVRAAAELTETAALAIHAAHRRGVIHRDLKPGNILLTGDGSPKITDFGLAKELDSTSGQTVSGALVGTPSYMAPEQAEGKLHRIGPATDVYALGAVLYEMLTGRPPFRGETAVETLMQVVGAEPVPPGQLRTVPRDLETICLKCLAKEVARRYPSAEELARDLKRFLAGEMIHARRPHLLARSLYWARRRPVVAGLVLALVLAVAGGVLGMAALWLRAEGQRDLAEQAKEDADQARATAEERLARMQVVRGVQLLDEGDWFSALAWFVRPLAEHRGGAGPEMVHRLRLASVFRQCPQLVQYWNHDGPVYFAAFSPDGQRAVTAGDDHTARIWDVARGQAPFAPLQHAGSVVYAAFSPDGQRLVTSSWDHTARVWNAATGKGLHTLRHEGEVQHAVFSPDGSRLVTASLDRTARLWDATSGKQLVSVKHADGVVDASFDSAGVRIVTASRDHTARVWDVGSGKQLLTLEHADQVSSAVFSPDGRQVLTASWDQTAQIWDVQTGRRATPALQHQKEVLRAVFSPDGRRVVTAGSDGIAQIWDAQTGRPTAPPLRHAAAVLRAAFSADGKRVVTASVDRTARLWEAATGQPVGPPLRHGGAVECAAISPDEKHVLTAGLDHGVRLWKLPTEGYPCRILRHAPKVWFAAFSPDEGRVVTAGADGQARLWDRATGRLILSFRRHEEAIIHAAFSADGRLVATASQDGTVRVWQAATGQEVIPPLEHQEVRFVSFSPDSRHLVTAGSDGRAQIWETATGKALVAFVAHREAVVHAAFSADGRSVVTAGWDGTARVWEAATGKELVAPLRHGRYVLDAAFAPGNARRLLTASADGTAQIWDLATGRPLLSPPLKHEGAVTCASFSPDGRLVVTASADGTARVWDATSGLPVAPPLKHRGEVRRASFSPDGRLVVTASADGTARVWDATNGLPITPALEHRGLVVHAAFCPSGSYLVTAGADGTARVWDLQPIDRTREDWLLLTDLLAGYRLDRAGGMMPIAPEALRDAWHQLRPGLVK